MARINFRDKKLYSSRTDRPGWFDNQHGGTRQNGLSEFESFKSSYTPQSNAKILLRNQYFISTRYHSGYGHSVSYDTFGRSNISSYPINESYTYSDSVYFDTYTKFNLNDNATFGLFSPNSIRKSETGTTEGLRKLDGTANLSYKSFDNGSNKAYRTKFYFKEVDYDIF